MIPISTQITYRLSRFSAFQVVAGYTGGGLSLVDEWVTLTWHKIASVRLADE